MKLFTYFQFKRLRADEAGVTLVEYGIALILAVIVGATALTDLGNAVDGSIAEAELALD